MAEPQKNGQQQGMTQDNIVYGGLFDLESKAGGTSTLKAGACQRNQTIAFIDAWGANDRAIEACLELALKKMRELRTGIVEP
jgi:hypothetical protein